MLWENQNQTPLPAADSPRRRIPPCRKCEHRSFRTCSIHHSRARRSKADAAPDLVVRVKARLLHVATAATPRMQNVTWTFPQCGRSEAVEASLHSSRSSEAFRGCGEPTRWKLREGAARSTSQERVDSCCGRGSSVARYEAIDTPRAPPGGGTECVSDLKRAKVRVSDEVGPCTELLFHSTHHGVGTRAQ